MWNRRQFIKAMGVLGGAVIAPFQWFGRAQAATPAGATPPALEGELYGGFVLLPEGASVPAFVRPRRLSDPDRCGMVEGDGVPTPKVVIEPFDNPASVKSKVRFPVYTFRELPYGLRQAKPYIARNDLGDIYGASIHFEAYDPATDFWVTAVSLWIQPDFPRPFPLWLSNPVESNGPFAALEKVDFLPSAGIKVAARTGFACYWIESDALFTLIAEPSPTGQDAKTLVGLLKAMS